MNARGMWPVFCCYLNMTSERVCFATNCGLNAAFGLLGYV